MSSIRTRPTASSRGLHQGVDVLQQNHPAARVESQIGAILPAQTQRPNEVGKVPFHQHPSSVPREALRARAGSSQVARRLSFARLGRAYSRAVAPCKAADLLQPARRELSAASRVLPRK